MLHLVSAVDVFAEKYGREFSICEDMGLVYMRHKGVEYVFKFVARARCYDAYIVECVDGQCCFSHKAPVIDPRDIDWI